MENESKTPSLEPETPSSTSESESGEKKISKWSRRRFFKIAGETIFAGGVLTTVRVSGYPDPPPDYQRQKIHFWEEQQFLRP